MLLPKDLYGAKGENAVFIARKTGETPGRELWAITNGLGLQIL